MDAIFTINPKYVDKILNGSKKIEYRKRKMKKSVKRIWIYSNSPIKKVVAVFECNTILEETPKNLWNATKHIADIDEAEFFNYFSGRDIAIGYLIENLVILKKPLDYVDVVGSTRVTQSFRYIY